jgi:glucokinase
MRGRLTRACFGVAGPEAENQVRMTNLPWCVDGELIARRFRIARVRVVNDFAAAATGVELLQPADLVSLQSGEPAPDAPRLVIGAGSGLGVAYLVRTAGRYRAIPGEGGHVGFAPSTPDQMELWRVLHSRLGRVAAEDLVSGPGLVRIFEFLSGREGAAAVPPGGARSITEGALGRGDPLCLRALDLFVSCFGAVAGDHALAVMARGGVYVTGGIAPKILPRLASGGFCAAFNAKGGQADAARKMPILVVTNERLGLLGAALIA